MNELNQYIAAVSQAMIGLTAAVVASVILQAVTSLAVVFLMLWCGRPEVTVTYCRCKTIKPNEP